VPNHYCECTSSLVIIKLSFRHSRLYVDFWSPRSYNSQKLTHLSQLLNIPIVWEHQASGLWDTKDGELQGSANKWPGMWQEGTREV